MQYVDNDYIESGHFDGIEALTYERKKIGFVVDTSASSPSAVVELLQRVRGEGYEDEINIVFGQDVKIAHKVGGAFIVSSIASAISEATEQRIASLESASLDMELIASNLLSNQSFLNAIAQRMSVSIVGQSGIEVISSLVFNADTNSYVLNYDTSLLDGSDYTIELKVI